MANYRLEIDALNALVEEQRTTNELLKHLLERGNNHGIHQNAEIQNDNAARGSRGVHGGSDKDGIVQPSTGRGKRGQRRNT